MTSRTLTQAELVAAARARFGEDTKTWAFVCPNCGDVAAAQDFIDAGADASNVGQECIGRSLSGSRGCNYAAYGLFAGPWAVVIPNGSGTRTVPTFALADAPAPALAPEPPSWPPLRRDTVHLLTLLAQGHGMPAAAAQLHMSYPVAKMRIRHGLHTWGVPNRNALTHLACIRGVLPGGLPSSAPVLRDLAARERAVLAGLTRGETYSQIGARLYLSRETIATYVGRALKARGAKTAAHLVYLAHQDGLLDGEKRGT